MHEECDFAFCRIQLCFVFLQVLWHPVMGSVLPGLHALPRKGQPGSHAACHRWRAPRATPELPSSCVSILTFLEDSEQWMLNGKQFQSIKDEGVIA